jgi:hypothetical protein
MPPANKHASGDLTDWLRLSRRSKDKHAGRGQGSRPLAHSWLACMQAVIPAHSSVEDSQQYSCGERLGLHEKKTLWRQTFHNRIVERKRWASEYFSDSENPLSRSACAGCKQNIYIGRHSGILYKEIRSRRRGQETFEKNSLFWCTPFPPLPRGAVTATSPKSSQKHGNPLGKGRFRWTGEINGSGRILDTHHWVRGTFYRDYIGFCSMRLWPK